MAQILWQAHVRAFASAAHVRKRVRAACFCPVRFPRKPHQNHLARAISDTKVVAKRGRKNWRCVLRGVLSSTETNEFRRPESCMGQGHMVQAASSAA